MAYIRHKSAIVAGGGRRQKSSRVFARTKPGTSLLVGLGLTTIIVLVSLGVTTTVVSSIRESANVTGANQAYYAAEGALEKGLLENQKHGAGYSGGGTLEGMNWGCVGGNTTVGTDTTAGSSLCGGPKQKASYTISGQVPDETKYADGYGIPRPGTGNVGEDCDGLNPITQSSFWYSDTTGKLYTSNPDPMPAAPFDAKDHPCNWSKLKIGEAVSIPLYYTDADGPHNIFTTTLQSFVVRIRTACTTGPNPEFCAPISRPNLDVTSKGDPKYKFKDPVVSWQIVGQSEDGSEQYVLSPIVDWKTDFDKWSNATSIIVEDKINATKTSGNVVLEVKDFPGKSSGIDANGCKGLVIKFLTNTKSDDPNCAGENWKDQKITKPVLKLSVIHSLDENPSGKIPYLEYQIIMAGSIPPPTDTHQTITAEGYSGSFKQVLQVKNPQDSGLLEYVIQQ